MYVCMYVCIMYVCIYVCMYVHVCMYVCTLLTICISTVDKNFIMAIMDNKKKEFQKIKLLGSVRCFMLSWLDAGQVSSFDFVM